MAIENRRQTEKPRDSPPAVGTKAAADQMFRLVYDCLLDLARWWFREESKNHTLQPTALVHEVYLKLVENDQTPCRDQTHFFAVAARAMREVLVDHARRKTTDKRGGQWRRLTLHDWDGATPGVSVDIISLDEAMTRLAMLHERPSRVVELRFFGGLTVDETARVLGVSARTIDLDWRFARAYLLRDLGVGPGDGA